MNSDLLQQDVASCEVFSCDVIDNDGEPQELVDLSQQVDQIEVSLLEEEVLTADQDDSSWTIKSKTKKRCHPDGTPENPASKKARNISQPSDGEKKMDLQILDARRLVDPFKVQRFFDLMWGRRVSISARGGRLSVVVISPKEREDYVLSLRSMISA